MVLGNKEKEIQDCCITFDLSVCKQGSTALSFLAHSFLKIDVCQMEKLFRSRSKLKAFVCS